MKNGSLIIALLIGVGFCAAPAISANLDRIADEVTPPIPPPTCVRVVSATRKGLPAVNYDDVAAITAAQVALTPSQLDDLRDGAYPVTLLNFPPRAEWTFGGVAYSAPICWI